MMKRDIPIQTFFSYGFLHLQSFILFVCYALTGTNLDCTPVFAQHFTQLGYGLECPLFIHYFFVSIKDIICCFSSLLVSSDSFQLTSIIFTAVSLVDLVVIQFGNFPSTTYAGHLPTLICQTRRISVLSLERTAPS